MFSAFNIQEFISSFFVLFAVIDVVGSIPVLLNLKRRGKRTFYAAVRAVGNRIFIPQSVAVR